MEIFISKELCTIMLKFAGTSGRNLRSSRNSRIGPKKGTYISNTSVFRYCTKEKHAQSTQRLWKESRVDGGWVGEVARIGWRLAESDCRTFASELLATMADGLDEILAVPPRRAILDGGIGEASLSAELASSIMVHYGETVGNVGRHVAGAKLPNEVIAHFDHGARPANVLRSYPEQSISTR